MDDEFDTLFTEFVKRDCPNTVTELENFEELRVANSNYGFKEAWSLPCIKGRFPLLETFAGGLACPFGSTASTESDFSILRYEKDDFRSPLEDLSLEGIFQCRNYTKIANLIN